MKHPGVQQSSRCISTVVALSAGSGPKMEKKDDESERSGKHRKPQEPANPVAGEQDATAYRQSTSLPESKIGGPSNSPEVKQLLVHPLENADRSINGEPAQSAHGNQQNDSKRASRTASIPWSSGARPSGARTSEAWGSRVRTGGAQQSGTQPGGAQHASVDISNLNDIPAESSETVESKVASKSSRSSKPSMLESRGHGSSDGADSIEGEVELVKEETMGSTADQYRHQMTREEHEALAKSLQDKTIKTLIHLAELNKIAYVDSQPPTTKPSIPPKPSDKTPEAQLYLLNKDLKSVARRINESKREKAFMLNRINDLEVNMFKRQGAEHIKNIMTKIPQDADLKDLEQIRQLMLERKRLQKEIEKLNMEMSAMNKAMENSEVIIGECSAIKKPRRVIIMGHPLRPVDEIPSQEAIGRGESSSKARGSPPATEVPDVLSSDLELVPADQSETTSEDAEENGTDKEPESSSNNGTKKS